MPVQLGLSYPDHRGLGVRHPGERRFTDRRAVERGGPDRRRSSRRKATLRSLLFSAFALALPNPGKLGMTLMKPAPAPRVSTTVNSYVAVPPEHAYDAIIREASQRYRVPAPLIRSVMI